MKATIIHAKNDPVSLGVLEELKTILKKTNEKELFDYLKDEKTNSNLEINLSRILANIKKIRELNLVEFLEVKDSIFSNIEVEGNFSIVLSTHSSSTKLPCLCVHSCGNFNENKLGGDIKTLCISDSITKTILYEKLVEITNKNQELIFKNTNNNFEIEIEATHHGPTTNKPITFIEIGSSAEFWKNKLLHKIITLTIIDSLIEIINQKENSVKKSAIYLGGLHYSKAKKYVKEYYISHICPKYNLEYLDLDMLKSMLSKETTNNNTIIYEKKGMGKEKTRVLELVNKISEEKNIEIIKK